MARPPKRPRAARNLGGDDAALVKKGTVDPTKMKQTQVESSEDEDEIPEKRLRFIDVLTEVPNGDAHGATELALPGRGLTEVESLESCKNLRKVEVKDNKLSDIGFLEMNHQLCWFGAAKNRIDRITGLANLASLAVLDLSDNRIVRLEGLAGLSGLKALIVARNRITRVEGLSPKRNPLLETLVLSHNQISECNMAPFPMLKKLSLANNQLHAFPGLAVLPQLTELRLNGNRISALTQKLQQPRLSIFDIGNNLLAKVEALEPLRGLLWIKSLGLWGNPVAQDMEDKLLKGLLQTLPRLEIVNNRRLQQSDSTQPLKKKGRRRSKCHSADAGHNEGATWRGGTSSKKRHEGGEQHLVWPEKQPHVEVAKKKRKVQPSTTDFAAAVPTEVKKKKKKRQMQASEVHEGAAIDTSAQQETGRPQGKKKLKKRKNTS